MKTLAKAISVICLGLLLVPGITLAETSEVAALKAQVDKLTRKLEAMDSKVASLQKAAPVAQATYVTPAGEPASIVSTSLDGIRIGGYVETQYNEYLGQTGGAYGMGRNGFDTADSFSMNAAKIWLEKQANPEGGVGFRIDMLAGTNARFYNRDANADDDTDFTFQQAYIQYIQPLCAFNDSKWLPHSVEILAGRFTTLAGFEVLDGPRNWNISRNIIFGNIPAAHTGIRATYSLFNDFLTVTHGLNNGWDVNIDNNRFKTIENAISFKPTKNTKWTTATYFGPEGDGRDNEKRFLITNVLNWDVTSKWSLVGEFDVGNQRGPRNAAGNLYRDGSAQWWSAIAGARYQINDKWATAYRLEVFNDGDHYRYATGGSFNNERIVSNTFTLEYKPYENVISRAEYRLDHGKADDANGKRNQSTIAGQLIYLF